MDLTLPYQPQSDLEVWYFGNCKSCILFVYSMLRDRLSYSPYLKVVSERAKYY